MIKKLELTSKKNKLLIKNNKIKKINIRYFFLNLNNFNKFRKDKIISNK